MGCWLERLAADAINTGTRTTHTLHKSAVQQTLAEDPCHSALAPASTRSPSCVDRCVASESMQWLSERLGSTTVDLTHRA